MCNCIKQVTDKLRDIAAKECEDNGTVMCPFDSDDGLQNQTLVFAEQSRWQLKTEFKYRSVFTKKNGINSRPKTHRINILFTFCPFCGEKYSEK